MKLMSWSNITEDEYRANITGLNTFFGAVLGFVLADVNTADLLDFARTLVFTSGIVIGILYVTASAQRWQYAVLNLVLIWYLPNVLPEDIGNPGRLQVTLAVWALMTVIIEALWAWQQRRDEKAKRQPA